MSINSKNSFLHPHVAAIISANILAFYFFAEKGLPFFMLLFSFWIDSIFIVFFEMMEMLFARKGFNTIWQKITKIIGYGAIKLFVLLFYAIFLFTFIGFQLVPQEQSKYIFQAMSFSNEWLNINLLIFLSTHIVYFIFGYLFPKKYLARDISLRMAFFDIRTILLHVVIVGGFFLYKFILDKSNSQVYANLGITALFMLLKTFVDLISFNINTRKEEASTFI